jgi:hypothetical protein
MPTSLTDIKNNNTQVLNDIQTLQGLETDLTNILATTPNLTQIQITDITNKINQLSDMRVNLYRLVDGLNTIVTSEMQTSQSAINDQGAAIIIVEDELNQTKKRLDSLNNARTNKLRLVEINTYYGKKYAEHTQFMKIIIYMLVPIIILSIFYQKKYVPSFLYYILIIVISFIGAIYLIYTYSSIVTRDSMNYNYYNFGFNTANAPMPNGKTSDPWASSSNTGGDCYGAACCSPDTQTYDADLNICVNL